MAKKGYTMTETQVKKLIPELLDLADPKELARVLSILTERRCRYEGCDIFYMPRRVEDE